VTSVRGDDSERTGPDEHEAATSLHVGDQPPGDGSGDTPDTGERPP